MSQVPVVYHFLKLCIQEICQLIFKRNIFVDLIMVEWNGIRGFNINIWSVVSQEYNKMSCWFFLEAMVNGEWYGASRWQGYIIGFWIKNKYVSYTNLMLKVKIDFDKILKILNFEIGDVSTPNLFTP